RAAASRRRPRYAQPLHAPAQRAHHRHAGEARPRLRRRRARPPHRHRHPRRGRLRARGQLAVSEERTQQATPKRRQEARRRGQVARSPDFTGAVAALGGLAGLAFYAPALYARLADVMRQDLGRLARPDLTQAEVANLGLTLLATLAIALMPIFLGLFLLGMAANVLQVGFLFTGQ